MTQITGDLNFAMDTSIYSTFVQDDWQIAPTVKVLYGVRYDLYQYPRGSRTRRSRRRRSSTSTRTTGARAPASRGRDADAPRARAASASCTTSRFSAATSRRCS
jgi:outer membrane receptor protein involved in Fe transport